MCEATDDSSMEELDVRSLVPAQRHEKIFQQIDKLSFGTSFVLVNDYDPKPLYYQLEAEYPNQFSWDYLERGPVPILGDVELMPRKEILGLQLSLRFEMRLTMNMPISRRNARIGSRRRFSGGISRLY